MRKTKGEKIPVIFSRSIYSRKTTKIIVGCLVIVVLIFSPIIHSKQLKAEEAVFYPENCSGSWSNSSAAAGYPSENKEGLSTDVAQPTGAGQEIVCKDFKGELPAGANIVKAELEFVWSIGERTIIPQPAPIEETFDPVQEEFEIIEEPILEEPKLEEPESEEPEATEPINEGPAVEESAPEAETEPSTEILPEVLPPTSWFKKIFALEAKAQEEVLSEIPAEEVEVLPLTEEANESVLPEEPSLEGQTETPTQAVEPSLEGETEAEVALPETVQGTALFDLNYGLGESPWVGLGQIERESLTQRFPIALNFADIEALKISLLSRMTLDGIDNIFLEAVKLVITHDGVTVINVVEGPDLSIDTLIDEVSDERYWAVLIKREKNQHYEVWYTDSAQKDKLLPTAKRLAPPQSVLEAAIDFLTPGPALPQAEVKTEITVTMEPEITQVVEPMVSTTAEPLVTATMEPEVETQEPLKETTEENSSWNFVAGNDLADEFSSIKLQDGLIFWLARDGKAIYIFNPLTQSLSSQSYDLGGGDNSIIYKGPSGEDRKAIFDFPSRKFDFFEIEKSHEE